MSALLGKLGRRSLESLFWRMFGTACLFFMHARLGQTLLPEEYGQFSFTLSIVTVLMLFATTGWPKAMMRLIPQYTVNQQWPLLKGMLLASHRHALFVSVLFSFALLLMSHYIADEQRASAFFYAALLLPVRALVMLRRSVFQSFQNLRGSILPDEVLMPGMMIAGLVVLGSISLRGVVLLYLAIACAVFIFTLVWVWKVMPARLGGVVASYRNRAWMRLAIPLFFGGLAQVILGQSGVFLLGMLGDMTGAGLFGASARIALFVTFVMTAVNVMGMPMMAAALHENDRAGLRALYRKSRHWSILGALPVFAGLAVFPDTVLSLFGTGFKDAGPVLQVLAFGQLCNAVVGLAGSLLVVGNAEKYFMNSMVVVTVLCVLTMLAVIPSWGAFGAACVYSASLAVLSILQMGRASRIAR